MSCNKVRVCGRLHIKLWMGDICLSSGDIVGGSRTWMDLFCIFWVLRDRIRGYNAPADAELVGEVCLMSPGRIKVVQVLECYSF